MTENLENTLNTILTKSLELAEKTGELVIEQGTDLLQQFFAWHTTTSIFYIILGLLIGFISYKIFKLIGRDNPDDFSQYTDTSKILGKYYEEFSGIMLTIFVLCGGLIVMISVVSVNILNLLQILVAPKLYLIEYFIK